MNITFFEAAKILAEKFNGTKHVVQWGSEYRTSLVFEWLKPVRSSNGPVFRSPSEWQTVTRHLNTRQLVRYSDGDLNTHLSIIQMPVINRAWAARYCIVLYLNVSVIRMCGIRIPTVFDNWKHLNTHFYVRISNGLVFQWFVYVLCPMY